VDFSLVSTELFSLGVVYTQIYTWWLWFGVAVARVGFDQRSLHTSGPVSTGMGDRVPVQCPVRDIYLGMYPATKVNSAWPSVRG